jgi:2-isopropylmalate synthase
MSREIKIYDTTLRDGTQDEGVSFSMEDKVRLTTRLDAFGIHYIEGGWPGSNPKDLRFFRRMQDVTLKHAKLAAFSMTRRAGGSPDTDANMQALLESGAPVSTVLLPVSCMDPSIVPFGPLGTRVGWRWPMAVKLSVP